MSSCPFMHMSKLEVELVLDRSTTMDHSLFEALESGNIFQLGFGGSISWQQQQQSTSPC